MAKAETKAQIIDNFVAGHGFFWPEGAEVYGKRYLVHAADLDVAISLCPQHRSVVQAGGHVGVWPKYLSVQFQQVYTFEPDYMNFQCLNKNVPETTRVSYAGSARV